MCGWYKKKIKKKLKTAFDCLSFKVWMIRRKQLFQTLQACSVLSHVENQNKAVGSRPLSCKASNNFKFIALLLVLPQTTTMEAYQTKLDDGKSIICTKPFWKNLKGWEYNDYNNNCMQVNLKSSYLKSYVWNYILSLSAVKFEGCRLNNYPLLHITKWYPLY